MASSRVVGRSCSSYMGVFGLDSLRQAQACGMGWGGGGSNHMGRKPRETRQGVRRASGGRQSKVRCQVLRPEEVDEFVRVPCEVEEARLAQGAEARVLHHGAAAPPTRHVVPARTLGRAGGVTSCRVGE